MKPQETTIADVNEQRLVIRTNRKGVYFDRAPGKRYTSMFQFVYEFDDEGIDYLAEMLEEFGYDVWGDLFEVKKRDERKVSDYYEQFETEYQDWSHLEIDGHLVIVTAPMNSEKLMYRFSRRKLESFIYDLRNPKSYVQDDFYG